MGFGEEEHRDKASVSFYHIRGLYINMIFTINLDFDHRLCSVWKVSCLGKLQKKVTMQSLRLRSGELCFPFFRADYPHKLYGIPYGRFVFSPTIIYLLNHYQSSINISMESNVGFFFLDVFAIWHYYFVPSSSCISLPQS